jgi:hypothetical protein
MRAMQRATSVRDPVFVVGYMHSGTTLMYRILGRNPALFSRGGETKFFEFLPALRDRFRDLSDPAVVRELVEYTLADLLEGFSLQRLRDPSAKADLAQLGATAEDVDTLTRALVGSRDLAGAFRLTFDHLASRAGLQRWLEKTPTHVFHIDEIVQVCPDARFIEITRDPRDVLASKKTRRADVWASDRYSEEQRRFKHLEKAYDPFWDALSWKSAIVAGRRARERYPERIYHVAYEQLVADPEATVREFCRFLELDFDPAMIDVQIDTGADRKGRSERQGIYTQSVGRWQKTLDEGELALIQMLVRAELAELAYPSLPVSARARAAALDLAARSQAHIAVRLYRRWRMGGTRFLRSVVGAYSRRLRVLLDRS